MSIPIPAYPPAELLAGYTMGGSIPVISWVLDNRTSSCASVVYTPEIVEKMLAAIKKGHMPHDAYPGLAKILYIILSGMVSCKGKTVAVIGTIEPWIEAILMHKGAKSVTTVEYNVLNIEAAVTEARGWSCISYNDYCKSETQYDMVCTFSSG